jgi:hypothetical protein
MQKRNHKDDSEDDDEGKTTGCKTHGMILILFIFYLSCVLTLHAAKSKPKSEIATKRGKDGQSLQRTSGEKLIPPQCVLKPEDSVEGLVLNDWFEDYENLPVHQNLVLANSTLALSLSRSLALSLSRSLSRSLSLSFSPSFSPLFLSLSHSCSSLALFSPLSLSLFLSPSLSLFLSPSPSFSLSLPLFPPSPSSFVAAFLFLSLFLSFLFNFLL